MKKISWFTPGSIDLNGQSWYSQGYQHAAINTIKSIQQKNVGVFYNREDIPFHINFCPPYYYQNKNKYNVGYTPWESTIVPEGWKHNMSKCDEIWATSEFVKNIYIENNVHNNIHVIPHGISEDFFVYDRELNNKFVFLHIGADSKRKNAQLVVDAFLELYEGKENFKLVLKYNKVCTAEILVAGEYVDATIHPQILGIPSNLSSEQMVDLYHKCHCLVYPTSGEGFGMIPFEAIATGMPTICTDLTGCSDFSKMSMPLKSTWGKSYFHEFLYGCDVGEWAIPCYDDLLILMKKVVDEYHEMKKLTMKSARIIHEEMSWSHIADKILTRLFLFENTI